jgi:predicted transposase YdaD
MLKTVLVDKFAELSREEIEAMFGLSELKQTRVYQEAREEGKLEGKQEGEVNLTLRLLRRKLSLEVLPKKAEETIRSLPIEKLERLGEELLTFTSIENLISWLDQFAPDSP